MRSLCWKAYIPDKTSTAEVAQKGLSRTNHMSEQTFLNEGGIHVTNARFIAKGRTYAVNGITSVCSYEIKPRRGAVVACALIALIAFFQGSSGGVMVGLLFLAFTVIGWLANPPTYSVHLMTASGESDAFTTKDPSLVGRIVHAINEAIVARG